MNKRSEIAALVASRMVLKRALSQIAYWGEDEESARVAADALRESDEVFKRGVMLGARRRRASVPAVVLREER